MGQQQDRTGTAGEGPSTFNARREAYYEARQWLAHLIDCPQLHVSVTAYKAKMTAAQAMVQEAHDAMMAA